MHPWGTTLLFKLASTCRGKVSSSVHRVPLNWAVMLWPALAPWGAGQVLQVAGQSMISSSQTQVRKPNLKGQADPTLHGGVASHGRRPTEHLRCVKLHKWQCSWIDDLVCIVILQLCSGLIPGWSHGLTCFNGVRAVSPVTGVTS